VETLTTSAREHSRATRARYSSWCRTALGRQLGSMTTNVSCAALMMSASPREAMGSTRSPSVPKYIAVSGDSNAIAADVSVASSEKAAVSLRWKWYRGPAGSSSTTANVVGSLRALGSDNSTPLSSSV